MAIIYLIRHGETDHVKKRRLAGRMEGVHINKTGMRQAEILAQKLAELPVKALYTSPLERTLETAEPIARAVNLELQVEPGLIEVDIGDWQDQALGRLKREKSWKSVLHQPSQFRFPGGETFYEAQMRIVNTLQSLSSQFGSKDTIFCVSHADPIRLAVAFFIGLPLDLFQRLSVSPASVSCLSIGGEGSRLLYLNLNLSSSMLEK